MEPFRKRGKLIVVGAILIVICLITVTLFVFDRGNGQKGPLENITISLPSLEQNALIYVAESQGLFAENGLNVTVVYCDSGVSALNTALAGKANLSVSAEFPFMAATFQKQPMSIIASIDKFENDAILVRTDHGITVPGDLKGKKIAVVRQTIAEFYLGRYLDLHGMSISDVTLVGITPAQAHDAIANGSVDALAIWQPFVDQIQKSVNNLEVWPLQNSQAAFGIISARDDWLANHTADVERFLRSLIGAEAFLVNNPETSRSIVKVKMGYDDAYMADIWSKNNFRVTLDQTMVVAMQDEAHWMMDNNLTTENQMPDLAGYIYMDGLLAVRHESVNIVR